MPDQERDIVERDAETKFDNLQAIIEAAATIATLPTEPHGSWDDTPGTTGYTGAETTPDAGEGIDESVIRAFEHGYGLRDDRDEETRIRIGLEHAFLRDRELRGGACGHSADGNDSASPSSSASSGRSQSGGGAAPAISDDDIRSAVRAVDKAANVDGVYVGCGFIASKIQELHQMRRYHAVCELGRQRRVVVSAKSAREMFDRIINCDECVVGEFGLWLESIGVTVKEGE